jgi:hypothetical protein
MSNHPVSIEYSIGESPGGKPCVVVKSQELDWDGRPVGTVTETVHAIGDIEQLVGFCLRCGNSDLMKAVRRPVYVHLHGPDHPLAKG